MLEETNKEVVFMATNLQNDLQRFIGDKMEVGDSAISLEQALEEFRAYQHRCWRGLRTILVNRSKRAAAW